MVGDAAKNQAPANPFRTIFDIKRLIGRKFSESDVQKDIKHFPYKYVVVSMFCGGGLCTDSP